MYKLNFPIPFNNATMVLMRTNNTKSTIPEVKDSNKPIIHPILSFLSIAILLGWLQLMPWLQSQSTVLGAAVSLNPTQIVSLTNLEREKAGLDPVKINDKLAQAAQAKAEDMLKFGYWDHFSPSKRPPWTFILDAHYDYRYAGENLAKDFYDAPSLITAWMNSPAHRDNILNDKYEDIGIAVIEGRLNDKDTVLVVQMFGTQFNPQDYINAQDRALQTHETQSGLLSSSLSVWDLAMSSQFMTAKLISLAVIVVLLGKVVMGMVASFRSPNRHSVSRNHWGHFVFLLILGVFIVITADGDIL